MKQKALLILFIFGFTAMTWAQGWERGRNPNHPRIPPAETVSVSGTLTVIHGMPAIRSGDTTYLVGRLSRLTGFIDGLREGAQVTIEGSAVASRQNSNLKFLNPAQLTLDGRSHDLTSPAPAFGFDRQFGTPGQNRHPRANVPQRSRQRQHGAREFRR